MNKKSAYFLGWVTLLGFGGGGLVLIYFFHEICPLTIFSSGGHLYLQLLAGFSYGTVTVLVINQIMKHPAMTQEELRYQKLFRMAGIHKMSLIGITFLAFCAGFGEEIFFRGFIQPYLGIWITAVLFVAVHGYLNPKRAVFFYGLFMCFDIAGMGWMYDELGPWSAISAHFMIDFILLIQIKNDLNSEDESLLRISD